MDPWKTTERQRLEHQMHAGFRAFGCCLFVIFIYLFINVKTDMTIAVTQALQSCLLRRYCPPAEYLRKFLCMILTGEVLQGLQSSGSGHSATCHLGGARRASLRTAWCGAGLGRQCTESGGYMRCKQHLHR